MQYLEKRNFTNAVQHIDSFSKKACRDVEISKVRTSNDWGLFSTNHNITGSELNEVIEDVQKYLIRFNSLQMDFVKEFQQIYAAFNAIDRDYIDAINNNIKSIEVVSGQAFEAGRDALDAIERAQQAQRDIKSTIETQKKIVEVLVAFKTKIDHYHHLENIDEIWRDVNILKNDIHACEEKIKGVAQTAKNNAEVIGQLGADITACNGLIENNTKLITSAQSEIDRVHDLIDEVSKKHNANLENFIESYHTDKSVTENKIAELREKAETEYNACEEKIKGVAQTAKNNTEVIEQLGADIKAYNGLIENNTKLITSAQSEIGRVNDLIDELSITRKEDLEKFIESYRNEKIIMEDRIDELQNKASTAFKVAGFATAACILSIALNLFGVLK